MKRITALAALLIFLLSGVPVMAETQKTSRLIVIDDNIVTLPVSTPLIIDTDGTILFPIDVFAKAFNVTYRVNQKDNTITVFKGSSFITFLPDNVVSLLDGTLRVSKSVLSGSKSYVQASAVASDLGRIYTVLLGSIPRIKTRSVTYLDSDIIKIIQSRPITDNPEISSPSHYLCIVGISNSLSDQLKYLKKTGTSAMFFVTRNEIKEHPEDIISILADGQPLGFTTEEGFAASGSSSYVQEFEQCNILLNKLARTTSALVLLPSESAYQSNTLASDLLKSGYKLWKYSYDYSKNGLRILPKLKWNSLVNVSNSSAYLLDDLIVYMNDRAFGVKSASDATIPVNFQALSE